ncbi:transposase [Desulfosporosinus sp. BICA1-9]|uniref:transposase n=1 Tax=Desulfosporosinus sp. BICA1-9 TaxID=1531958 RepID=UPI0025BDBA93|nr:transposase [Desulfosporosinus sp. BICA1-9]
MFYDPEKDEYTCHNGKQLKVTRITHKTSSTGYRSEITVYECDNCQDCPVKTKCTKAKGNRQMHVLSNWNKKATAAPSPTPPGVMKP